MVEKKKAKNRKQHIASFFGAHRAPKGNRVAPGVRAEGVKPVAAHVFSGRFILLALVLLIVVVAAYAPLSSFFKQQAEINQVKSNISSLQSENENLKTQLSWWEDDNYVKQQAKSRLYYVTEGETPYLVVGNDFKSEIADDTSAAAQTAPQQSWTNNLWNSFQESAVTE